MDHLLTFLTAFGMVVAAEMGDKTQLLVMSMATKFKTRDIITGVTLAITVLNIMAVLLGSAITTIVPMQLISFIAGVTFIVFALWSVLDENEDEKSNKTKMKLKMSGFLTVALTFFVAELGDKTQLSAIVLSAKSPDRIISILLGCILGMVVADLIGLTIGKIIGKKIPQQYLKWISVVVFGIFGLATLLPPLKYYFGKQSAFLALIATSIVMLIIIYFLNKKTKK